MRLVTRSGLGLFCCIWLKKDNRLGGRRGLKELLMSRLTSGLLFPDKSSGLSEFGSLRPSIGEEDLGYFAAFDPRSNGESSSIDLFLVSGEPTEPFLSPLLDSDPCCLAKRNCAAWSCANWAAYRLGLSASRWAGSKKGFLSKSIPDVGAGAPGPWWLPGDLVLTGEKEAGGSRASSIGMVSSGGPGAGSSGSLPTSDSTHSRSEMDRGQIWSLITTWWWNFAVLTRQRVGLKLKVWS